MRGNASPSETISIWFPWFSCAEETPNARDYSNGFNLFAPLPEKRPIVVASYIHHALILDDNVFVVWPMYVQRYRLDGKKTVTGWPDASMMRAAMEEVTRFYAPIHPTAPVTAEVHVAVPPATKGF